jgi:rod shape-determining protein MreC
MNKRLKIIFALLFFSYFAVYLFSLTFTHKPQARIHEKIIVAISSPVQYIVGFTYDKVTAVISHYVFLIGTSKKNEELEAQNGELRQKVVGLEELKQENERLRNLLSLPNTPKYSAIYGERIAFGSNAFERTITVNKGTDDKVEVGMPVINPYGVVGQVAEVFTDYSNILLLTDKSSAIDVVIQRTRSRGILKGFTQHQLSFEFLSVDEDLQVGDIVISSGLDGVYPEGIPVGIVSATGKQGRRLFVSATVDPYVNFSKVEEVRILAPRDRRPL